MKIKLMIMAVGAGFVLSSCGEKKVEEGEKVSKEEAAKIDTAEDLAGEVSEQFDHMLSALKSVKDKESAEMAAKKIEGIGDSMVAISKRAMEIEKPTEEQRKALDAKMKEKMKGFQGEVGSVMKNLMTKPEAMQVIGGAMQKFAGKMEEAEAGFDRLGKDSN